MADDASVGSSSSSEANWNEFIGLPDDFELEEDEISGDEVEEGLVENCGEDSKDSNPLYSLKMVELLAIESNADQLDSIMKQVREKVGEEACKANEVYHLQLGILQMACDLARGNYMKVIESPVVEGVIAGEQMGKHTVSRVKNRMARFLHERVIEHIHVGLGSCIGRKTFREPTASTPEDHVNQRTLRAVGCMFLGAACLGLFMQANWTGPPVNAQDEIKWYPLPFVGELYDNKNTIEEEQAKEEYIDQALAELDADANAASAASGRTVHSKVLDMHPQLHARCALMLAANGETVYRDAKYLHYLHVARVILRILVNPTMTPGAVDPVDMLEVARKEVMEGEHEIQEDEHGNTMLGGAKVREKVVGDVRIATANLITSGWWAARSASTHQETLIESTLMGAPSLIQEMEQGFERTLRKLKPEDETGEGKNQTDLAREKEVLSRLWLERGVSQHKFKLAEKAKQSFATAKETAGLFVQLSGALGKRTKFQQQEKAQLILLASSDTTKLGEEEQPQEKQKPKYVTLEEIDQDTPYHETVQLTSAETEEEEVKRRGTLSLIDQCIVLALCIDVKNSYALEGLTSEEMLAYVERVIQSSENWMIYSTGLLIKAQLEFERWKTKERAVLQMQALIDQQSDRLTPLQMRQQDIDDAAPVQERFLWLHGLAWPALWELKRGLAERYKDLGVAGSALKIYEEVKMWEEAVDCLVMMDKRSRAEKLIRTRLEVQPTPNLMCVLGNLLQDPSWYEKAWELSQKKYPRAKRLWATHVFSQGDFKGAIGHLQDALDINPLYPGSWFRLGAAALRLEDWKLARNAFAQVTKQEPEDGEAWSNLSTALLQLGENQSALGAIANAVRYARTNWKIWDNYISLCVSMKQWGMAIYGISSQIDLNAGATSIRADEVDIQSLLLIIDGIIQSRKTATTDADKQTVQRLHNDIIALFDLIKEKCKSDPNVWKAMAIYYDDVGDHAAVRECLMRRVRAFQNKNLDWQKDEDLIEKITSILSNLYSTYLKHIDTHAQTDQEKADIRKQATSIVQTIIDRIDKGPLRQDKSLPLRQLLQ